MTIFCLELHNELLDRERRTRLLAGDGDASVWPELHSGQCQHTRPQFPGEVQGAGGGVHTGSRLPGLLRDLSAGQLREVDCGQGQVSVLNQSFSFHVSPFSEGRMGPYAYKDNQWVGFDDIDTIRRKSEYIRSMGLGGGMVWALDLDDFNNRCGLGRHPLMNTIKSVLGPAKNHEETNLEDQIFKEEKDQRRNISPLKRNPGQNLQWEKAFIRTILFLCRIFRGERNWRLRIRKQQ